MTAWGWILMGLAALIIGGMAVYAGRLLYLLRAQNRKQRAFLAERRSKIVDSLHLLAGALERGELVASEGAIRCCELLLALPKPAGDVSSADLAAEYPGLFGLYREVKKLPRGEERQRFSKKQLMRMDWERSRLEAEMAEQILTDARKLKQLNV